MLCYKVCGQQCLQIKLLTKRHVSFCDPVIARWSYRCATYKEKRARVRDLQFRNSLSLQHRYFLCKITRYCIIWIGFYIVCDVYIAKVLLCHANPCCVKCWLVMYCIGEFGFAICTIKCI